MRQLLLIFPVLLTLLVSGCTAPGGFCIPGITCGQTVEETHDVIVIESLQALPNDIPPGGTINLVAIVSNVADIDAEITRIENVHVELYDYCSGLFDTLTDGEKIKKIDLLRGEKKQIEWTLKAKSQVPVKTECNLKVLARYPYATKSITTLHLIDYTEMQRRINEGTYGEVGSYISVGYGPIKPYVRVEGTQPIPVQDNKVNTVISLQIINKGNGFLTTKDGKPGPTGPKITKGILEITGLDTYAGEIKKELDKCINEYLPKPDDGLKLINDESTKIPCPIDNLEAGPVPVESTKTIQASVGKWKDNPYWYEFRKEIRVTVEPKF